MASSTGAVVVGVVLPRPKPSCWAVAERVIANKSAEKFTKRMIWLNFFIGTRFFPTDYNGKIGGLFRFGQNLFTGFAKTSFTLLKR